MTAKWEQRLAEIGEGTASPATFMEQTKKLSAKIIEDAVEMSEKWDFTGLHVESIERKDRNLQQVKRLVAVKM